MLGLSFPFGRPHLAQESHIREGYLQTPGETGGNGTLSSRTVRLAERTAIA